MNLITRNIQRTSFFYKEGNLRKTIDFIYPKQKTWTPVKIVTLYNTDEEIHCDDGPARVIKCLEHKTLMVEEYYHKGIEIFEEGFQLLQKMLFLQRNKHLMPEEKFEDGDVEESKE